MYIYTYIYTIYIKFLPKKCHINCIPCHIYYIRRHTEHTHTLQRIWKKKNISCSCRRLRVGVTEDDGFGAKAASRMRKSRWRGILKAGMPRGPRIGDLQASRRDCVHAATCTYEKSKVQKKTKKKKKLACLLLWGSSSSLFWRDVNLFRFPLVYLREAAPLSLPSFSLSSNFPSLSLFLSCLRRASGGRSHFFFALWTWHVRTGSVH